MVKRLGAAGFGEYLDGGLCLLRRCAIGRDNFASFSTTRLFNDLFSFFQSTRAGPAISRVNNDSIKVVQLSFDGFCPYILKGVYSQYFITLLISRSMICRFFMLHGNGGCEPGWLQ